MTVTVRWTSHRLLRPPAAALLAEAAKRRSALPSCLPILSLSLSLPPSSLSFVSLPFAGSSLGTWRHVALADISYTSLCRLLSQVADPDAERAEVQPHGDDDGIRRRSLGAPDTRRHARENVRRLHADAIEAEERDAAAARQADLTRMPTPAELRNFERDPHASQLLFWERSGLRRVPLPSLPPSSDWPESDGTDASLPPAARQLCESIDAQRSSPEDIAACIRGFKASPMGHAQPLVSCGSCGIRRMASGPPPVRPRPRPRPR